MVLILAKMKMLVEAKGAEEEDIGREVKLKRSRQMEEEEVWGCVGEAKEEQTQEEGVVEVQEEQAGRGQIG